MVGQQFIVVDEQQERRRRLPDVYKRQFLLFVNNDELLADQYKKYLADEMRVAFGYEGCPIVLAPKARPKTIEPVRKFKPARGKEPGKFPQRPERPPGKFSPQPKKKSRSKSHPRGSNRAKGRR